MPVGRLARRSTSDLNGATNLTDATFGLKMEETLTCPEAGNAEPSVKKYDTATKLVCNIQGGPNSKIQVGHIAEGIDLGLTGEVEKNSAALGRNAVWTKKVRVREATRQELELGSPLYSLRRKIGVDRVRLASSVFATSLSRLARLSSSAIRASLTID